MMEHTGTHIDALCHQACGFKMYGDVPVEQVETPAGFTKLGIETVPPLLGRGVLLDVARHLRRAADTAFDICSDVTAVDWPPRADRFDVVYCLFSRTHRQRLRARPVRPGRLRFRWRS